MGLFEDFSSSLSSIFQSLGFTNPLPMYLGDGVGNVIVPPNSAEEPGSALAYVHTQTGVPASDTDNVRRTVSQALNPYGFSEHGLPIITAEHMATKKRVIVGIDPDRYVQFSASTGFANYPTQKHAASHYLWGAGGGAGADAVFIESLQVVNLEIHPLSGLTVQWIGTSNRSVYVNNDGEPQVRAGSLGIDLTASVPGTADKARWVCLSLDVDAGTITITNGSEFDPVSGNSGIPPVILDVDAANMPDVPSGEVGKAYVYLEEGQTEIYYQHIRKIHNLAITDSGGTSCINIRPNPNTLEDATLQSTCNLVLCGPIDITGTFVCDGQLCII